jgi:hypothetical protein
MARVAAGVELSRHLSQSRFEAIRNAGGITWVDKSKEVARGSTGSCAPVEQLSPPTMKADESAAQVETTNGPAKAEGQGTGVGQACITISSAPEIGFASSDFFTWLPK